MAWFKVNTNINKRTARAVAGDLRKRGVDARASRCGEILIFGPKVTVEDVAALRMTNPEVARFSLRVKLVH